MSKSTRVVNLRHTRKYDVYIGRGGNNIFGNPIARHKTCPVCGEIHHEPGSTLDCYKVYLKDRLRNDADFREQVRGLHGKTLGCFCKPNPCHGDILSIAADWLSEND